MTPTDVDGPDDGDNDHPWALFDRSRSNAYPAGRAGELVVHFDGPTSLSRIKVLGPASYRLSVVAEDGTPITAHALDLTRVPTGWSSFDLPRTAAPQRQVRLSLEPQGNGDVGLAEVELWSTGTTARIDGSEDSDGDLVDIVPSTQEPTEVDLGVSALRRCASWPFTVSRHPGVFRQVFLSYHAEHAFRPFVLERSVNGHPVVGGHWLTSYAGDGVFVEMVDPETIELGDNTLDVCMPNGATGDVHLEDLSFIGLLDNGSRFVTEATSANNDRSSLVDHDAGTGVTLSKSDRTRLAFERAISVDAVLVRERGASSRFSFRCETADGRHADVHVRGSSPAGDAGTVFTLVPAHDGCSAIEVRPLGDTGFISEIEVLGSGAAERIDWPTIQVSSTLEHFGDTAVVEGWVRHPSAMTGGIRISIEGSASDSLDDAFDRLLRRSDDLGTPWPVTISALLPSGESIERTITLTLDSRDAMARANTSSSATGAGTLDPTVAMYGRPGSTTWSEISPTLGGDVRLGTHVGVHVPDGAVGAPTRVTINHLDTGALPPLDPSLVNVTSPRDHAYEFLPHGQRFRQPVQVTLPFDVALLPEGMTADDVKTYYYDEYSRTWQPLQRAAVDSTQGVVQSLTDHFTVMINAVLAVPESPTPLSFDPTSLSSLAAADPAANIDFIAPPEPTSSGDANLQVPIWLPAGRGAYSPSVSIDYSSSASNDWVGRGWNVRLPSINVDSRYGVPTYSPDENPRYLFEGEPLVPVLANDGPSCLHARRYRPRTERQFSHIVRCGSNASDYYWQVRTTDGTTLTFGDSSPEGSGNAALRDPTPNRHVIASWFVRRIEDANGNRTDFSYVIDADSPAGGEPWVAAYPARIDYTAHGNDGSFAYHVDFVLDDGSRPDAIVSGRLGFKTLVRRRLRSIRARLGEDVIREYVLVYRTPTAEADSPSFGAPDAHFYKSLLESVHVFGVGGCSPGQDARVAGCEQQGAAFFYAHRFEYFDEEAGFEDVEEWSTDEERSMSEAFSVGANGHLYVGLGLGPRKRGSVGVRFGVGGSMRQQQVAFQDVNGDGLVDQIVRPVGGSPHVLFNQARPGSVGALSTLVPVGNPGEGAALPVTGLRQLGRDVNVYFNFAAQVFFNPATASASWGRSLSWGRVFLTDLDGDGFVDVLDRRDGNQYGALRQAPNGSWSYAFDSSGPNLHSYGGISSSSDTAITEIAGEVRSAFFIGDPVRRWVAPYSGRVRVDVFAQRSQVAPSAGDGAIVEVWRGTTGSTTLLTGCSNPNVPCRLTLSPEDLAPHRLTPTNGLAVDVTAGEVLYLKTGTGADVPYLRATDPSSHDIGLDSVAASLAATYETYCSSSGTCSTLSAAQTALQEPAGGQLFAFDTVQDFRLAGGMPNTYELSVAGDVAYQGRVEKTRISGDDVRACVQLFHTTRPDGSDYDNFSTDVPCGASREFVETSGTTTIAHDFVGPTALTASLTARSGDLLLVRLESDLSSDPGAVTLVTEDHGLAYTSTCDTNGVCRAVATDCCAGDAPANSCNTDPQAGSCVCLDPARLQAFTPAYAHTLRTSPLPWIPSSSQRVTLVGQIQAVRAGRLLVGVRSESGALIAKRVEASCPIPGPDVPACALPFSIDVDAIAGVPLYLDLVAEADANGNLSTVDGYASRVVPPTSSGGSTTYVPVPMRLIERRPTDSAMGGGFHGLSYFVWNESEPFEPHLITTWRDQDAAELEHASSSGSSGPVDLKLPSHVQPMRTSAAGSSLSPGIPAWVGPSEDAFLSSTMGHAARTGGRTSGACGAEGVDVESGLSPTDYGRLAVSQSLEAGAGLGSLNAAVTTGWTKSTTDVFDVDGDGIADAITSTGIERGVIERGSREVPSRPNWEQNGAFRVRESRGYSIGLGINPSVPDTSSSGKPLSVQTRMPAPSFGAGVAIARNVTTRDLVDVNGDGLPDRISRAPNAALTVELNLGHRFAAPESLSIPLFEGRIDAFADREGDVANGTRSPNALDHETTVSTSFNVGVASPTGDFGASLNFNLSSTRAVSALTDINGDGLPDMVFKRPGEDFRVAFNLGNGFSQELHAWPAGDWGTALDERQAPTPDIGLSGAVLTAHEGLVRPDVVSGTGRLALRNGSRAFEVGGYFNISIPTSIVGLPFIQINPGLGASYETDEFQLALIDVDGDGSSDHVIRRGDRQAMYVKRNRITGREGLLRRVVTPLGGSISLDYARTTNTVDTPHSRQVLARVEIDDGIDLGAGFESPNIVTTIRYDGGYFDRAEQDFFGFANVVVERMNGSQLHSRTALTYENRQYALRGTLLRSVLTDSEGRTFDEVIDEYAVVSARDASGDVVVDPSCVAWLHPRLPDSACDVRFPARLRSTHRFAEGDHPLGAKAAIEEWTNYDRFGNVLRHVDHGDDGSSDDDVATDMTYRYDSSRWIVARVTQAVATPADATQSSRVRSASYDARGNLVGITLGTNAGDATTSFDVDVYGNVSRVTTPSDEYGNAQVYDYDYDPTHHKYVMSTTDAFGLHSSSTHDMRFGTPRLTTDTNGSAIDRTYDSFGRLASVRGPYDNTDAMIDFAYALGTPSGGSPAAIAVTTNRASPPPGFTGPTPPPVVTVMVVDGFGQELQRSKSASVAGNQGTTTSTRGSRDALGRDVVEWTPSFRAVAPSGFVVPESTFATRVTHDVLDRAIRTDFPDGTSSSATYDLALDPIGHKTYRQRAVDGNGHSRESYFAQEEELVSFVEHPSAGTSSVVSYRYDAFGDLSGITDAEGNETTIAYDSRGLMTRLANPDTGLIEIEYDLMGNAIHRTEPNHRANGTSIHYLFDRGRHVGTDFPTKVDISIEYGVVGAAYFGAGRVVRVTDETGSVETRYGALGEVVRERRVVNTSTGPHAYGFESSFVYDSLNRLLAITYPDGELVTNTYDAGGSLSGVGGVLDGVSRVYARQIEYDVHDHRTRLVNGNGVESRWSFDPSMQRLASSTTTLSGNRRAQALTYGYDGVGNLTSMASSLASPRGGAILGGPGSWSMVYDGVDRLTTASATQEIAPRRTTSYIESFHYTPSHNISSKTREHTVRQPGGAITRPPGTQLDLAYRYASSRPHAPTLVGDLEVTYDPSGNPLERTRNGSVQELVWDDDGRLVEVQHAGTYLRNSYDATGRRVVKRGQNGETLFVNQYFDHHHGVRGMKHIFAGRDRVATVSGGFDAPNVDASGTYTGVCGPPGQGGTVPGQGGTPPGHCPPYVLAPPTTGDVASSTPNFPPRAYYVHLDHLGSTSVVTDDSGEVHEYLQYFPDGEVWIDGGPQNPVNGYRFSGKMFDPETGWYDFGQRFYDPQTSLWLGTDDAFTSNPGSARGEPSALAMFGYANQNPFGFVDPDGHWAKWVHRMLTRRALRPFMRAGIITRAQLRTIVRANVHVDKNQNENEQDWHSMQDADATPEESIRRSNVRVNRQLTRAAMAGHHNPQSEAALKYIGRGAHTVQDSFSPEHRFDVPWDASDFEAALNHTAGEVGSTVVLRNGLFTSGGFLRSRRRGAIAATRLLFLQYLNERRTGRHEETQYYDPEVGTYQLPTHIGRRDNLMVE